MRTISIPSCKWRNWFPWNNQGMLMVSRASGLNYSKLVADIHHISVLLCNSLLLGVAFHRRTTSALSRKPWSDAKIPLMWIGAPSNWKVWEWHSLRTVLLLSPKAWSLRLDLSLYLMTTAVKPTFYIIGVHIQAHWTLSHGCWSFCFSIRTGKRLCCSRYSWWSPKKASWSQWLRWFAHSLQ